MLSDYYCVQYNATLAWLDRALQETAERRRAHYDPGTAGDAERLLLARLSGAVQTLWNAGSADDPPFTPGAWTFCDQPAAACLEPAGGSPVGLVLLWQPEHKTLVELAARYAAAGLRVVVPLLARPSRTFAEDAVRSAIAFGDDELVHLFAFILGGSLAGLEASALTMLAQRFGQAAMGRLPAVLDVGGRAHLSSVVAAALRPPSGDKPLFSLLVLPPESRWLDRQEGDARVNTIWSFHKYFDGLTLLSLARPAHLLFVEQAITPSDLYCRVRTMEDGGQNAPRQIARTSDAARVDAVLRILAGASAAEMPLRSSAGTAAACSLSAAEWDAHYRRGLECTLAQLEERLVEAEQLRVRRTDLNFSSPEQYRDLVAQSLARVTGGPLPETGARRPRTRLVRVGDTHRVYFVVLESVPGVDVAGFLLLPEGNTPTAGRPAVICQHGLGGRPDAVAGLNEELADGWVYDRVAERLAQAGYVTFAPFMNWGWARTEQRDALVKRAFALGFTPNRFEVAQLHAIVDFLQERPEVDPRRIGFYGLSYGGHASLWLAAEEPRLAAVVTAGHFNQWQRKLTSLEISPPLVRPTSYISVDEGFDMFNYNVCNELGHSELATRHAPRACFVENGLFDTVTPTAWVEEEFARVRAVYRWLGYEGRAVLENFPGPHRVWAQGSFAFLHAHLMQPDRMHAS